MSYWEVVEHVGRPYPWVVLENRKEVGRFIERQHAEDCARLFSGGEYEPGGKVEGKK